MQDSNPAVHLTATKAEAAALLSLSEDSVERLLMQERLKRIPGIASVRITLSSLAAYTSLPLDFVENACRNVAARARPAPKKRVGWPLGVHGIENPPPQSPPSSNLVIFP